MDMFATILVGLIALLHVIILVLEMFLWTKTAGRRAFGLTSEFAQATKVLAANQGLYNGFLAAGLVWSLLSATHGFELKIFFLLCVLVAGIFGAITANKKILFVQAIPALLGLIAVVAAAQ